MEMAEVMARIVFCLCFSCEGAPPLCTANLWIFSLYSVVRYFLVIHQWTLFKTLMLKLEPLL